MNKRNPEEIVKKDNTGVNMKRKEIESSDSIEEVSKENVEKKNRRRKRHKLQRKRTKLQSSQSSSSDWSDDCDVPLSVIAGKSEMTPKHLNETFDDSDNDVTYKPNSKDLNSSDSEYSSNLSDGEKEKIKERENIDKQLQKDLEEARKARIEMEKSTIPVEKASELDSIASKIQKIKEQSMREAVIRQTAIEEQQEKIDQLLYSNGLERVQVRADGNCFFEAACLAIGAHKNENAQKLRQDMCKHLDKQTEEYIGFLMNKNMHTDDESFLLDYMMEIEELKNSGYWSNTAADFLPLALSNMYLRDVRIYSNKSDQPIIEITPTLGTKEEAEPICLSYISLPNIIEHYDGCKKLNRGERLGSSTNTQDAPRERAPVPNEEDSNENQDVNQEEEQRKSDDAMEDESPAPSPKSVPPSTSKKTTPRKSAKFVTPVKKKLSRRRKSTPEGWKKNVRKQLHLTGKAYTSSSGKLVESKCVQPVNCEKCRFKCNSKFPHGQRERIFNSFWSLGSYERQKDFVCSMVDTKPTRTYVDEHNQTTKKKRMVSRRFSLYDEDDIKQNVCKKFFLSTINLGEAYVDHALKNKSEGRFMGSETRGKHKPHNKTDDKDIKAVKEHIESFPKVEGHYTRKATNREFLGAELNITKMYELYKEKMLANGDKVVTLAMYRKIFNENYNFSFHVPKKDQCNLCTAYYRNEVDGCLTEEMKAKFKAHQDRKLRARQEKDKDKTAAKSSNTTYTATFDLQSVLYTPCSMVSLMYYMRKLCCYNLSVYGLGNNRGACYVWSEVDAKRGSCEIATCLRLHLLSLPANIEHVVLYSDACGGQNRNQVIATCLLDAVTSIGHIKTIDHKFLESGHTQMECDSMHSAIEFAKKKTAIFVPSQWDTVIAMARRKDPYTVVPMKYYDIIDYKQVQNERAKVSKVSDSGKKVLWTKIRWMRYLESETESCLFKYNYDDDFEKVKLFAAKKGAKATNEINQFRDDTRAR